VICNRERERRINARPVSLLASFRCLSLLLGSFWFFFFGFVKGEEWRGGRGEEAGGGERAGLKGRSERAGACADWGYGSMGVGDGEARGWGLVYLGGLRE